MSLLCCLQAAALARTPHKSLFLAAQAAVPLFDQKLQRSKVSLGVVVLQTALYAASLLLSAAAVWFDPYHGGSGVNALVKSLGPVICLLLKRSRNRRNWIAALVSYAGFLLAVYERGAYDSANVIGAYLMLFGGTLAGVLLGFAQEKYGACSFEMAAGTTLVCLVSLVWAPPALADLPIIDVAMYALLSFVTQHIVRDYSDTIAHNPLKLSLALNERRALTIAFGAFGAAAPLRLLVGSAVVLASVAFIE